LLEKNECFQSLKLNILFTNLIFKLLLFYFVNLIIKIVLLGCDFSLTTMMTSVFTCANFVSDLVAKTHAWVVLFICANWNFILAICFLSIFFITTARCWSVVPHLIVLTSAYLNNNVLVIETWIILLIFLKRFVYSECRIKVILIL